MGYVSLFVLGFSSLLPLVNPAGTALIINPYFSGCTYPQRRWNAFTIIFFCLGIGLSVLVLGSWCLRAMGISIATTQLAGGFVIAKLGLSLLDSKSDSQAESPRPEALQQSLFYPLAFPLTVGPGVISTLIALSAHAHSSELSETAMNLGALALALIAVLGITYFCFVYSDAVMRRVGETGSKVFNRLMAFLVFCIGIQMAVTGLSRSFPHLFQ